MFFPADLFYIAVCQEQKPGHKEYVNNNQSFLGFWVSARENQACLQQLVEDLSIIRMKGCDWVLHLGLDYRIPILNSDWMSIIQSCKVADMYIHI